MTVKGERHEYDEGEELSFPQPAGAPASDIFMKRPMRRDTRDTRLKIMRAAERLFATRGIGGVSIAEINVAAEQRNRSAVQYHFADKRTLLEEIVFRHLEPVHESWLAALDVIESGGAEASLRDLVKLLVDGHATKLDDPDSGREYLSISAQLVHDPNIPLSSLEVSRKEAPMRLMSHVLGKISTSPELLTLRSERVIAIVFQALASRAAAEANGHNEPPRSVFLNDLVDSVVAVLDPQPARA
jgi:AcrR family transcriptional regulator